jgi:carbon-monoxide dehydrogenase medium subunit
VAAYDYVAPRSLGEVVAILTEHGDDAHVIAGGASALLMLRQQLIVPTLLVGLRAVPGLDAIEALPDGGLRIGAMATHRRIERSPQVAAYAPALAEAVGLVATVRIRNQGTIGGNLAHADPAQDPPPILLALDAAVETLGPDGPRTLPLTDLFLDYFETTLRPAEIITAVILPPRPAGARAVYRKFLPRSKDDYATVAVAVSGVPRDDGTWSGIRIACGAAGPVPVRVAPAEALAEGSMLDDAMLDRVAEVVHATVDPIADQRGSSDYKRAMAAVWVTRALRSLAGQQTAAVAR